MQQQTIPPGLCQCGCGEKTNLAPHSHAQRGWVKGEPLRFLAGHGNSTHAWKEPRYAETDCGYATPCWIWLLARNREGYGYVQIQGIPQPAHRVYYERHVGPIPEGLTIDHLCRNPRCVNPAHLEPVTEAENIRRSVAARRCDDIRRIRLLHARGNTQSAISRQLGVSRSFIRRVAAGHYADVQ